jgi:guanine deaminase
MNQNCPSTYIEASTEASLADTKSIVAHIRNLPAPVTYSPTHSLVHPILTPRFAISCTSPLLSGLGALAASDRTLRIQTHISENAAEVAFTRELFPQSKTYAGVYDDHGLLRDNTVLAHAVHLEEEELVLIAQRKAGISHCPTSNFNLRSGLAKVGEMLDRGIKVTLPIIHRRKTPSLTPHSPN